MNRIKSLIPFLTVMMFCGLLFVSGCSDPRYLSEKLYWQAEKNFAAVSAEKGKDLSEADFRRIISGYEKVIKEFPLEALAAKAHFKISNLYLSRKMFDKAREELKTIICNFSSNSSTAAGAQFSLAKIYEIEQNKNRALTEYEKIPELYPLTSLGLQTPLYLVQYLSPEDKTGSEEYYHRYLEHYRKVLNDYSDTSVAPRILQYIALIHGISGNTDKSLEAYDRIIDEFPLSKDAFQALAAKAEMYLKKLNDIPSAISVYEVLTDNYSEIPLTANFKAQLGWLYLKQGDVSRAEELFRAVKSNEHSLKEAKMSSFLGLAYIFREQKKIEKAVLLYEQIRDDFADSRVAVAVPFLIARLYLEAEDSRAGSALEAAIWDYEDMLKYLSSGKKQRTAAHYLTLAYLQNNEPEKALSVLEKLVRQYPDSPGYMLDVAQMYAGLKQNEKAIDVYSSLIDKYTDNEYLVNLSRSKIEQIHSMDTVPELPGPGLD